MAAIGDFLREHAVGLEGIEGAGFDLFDGDRDHNLVGDARLDRVQSGIAGTGIAEQTTLRELLGKPLGRAIRRQLATAAASFDQLVRLDPLEPSILKEDVVIERATRIERLDFVRWQVVNF